MGLSFFIALENGTYTIWSFCIPIITLRWPSISASIAAAPMRLANIRSWAEGEPPRCKCPKIDTRTSYWGNSFFTRSARCIAPPVEGLSESVFDEFSQLVDLCGDLGNNSGFCTRCDGAVQCQKTGVASHDFNKEQSLMRSCRITYFVDCFHDGVQGRVIPDRGVGTEQVVVNSSG